MQRRQLLVAAASACVTAPLRAAGVLSEWRGPPQAPPIDLLDPIGQAFSLSSLRGRVVLVNFWATWCEPCVTEMPSLQQLRDDLLPDFEVLGVNYQESPARIRAFLQKTAITFPVVRDSDGAVAKAWGVRIFPASYLVDRSGAIRSVLIGGADWTSPALVSRVRALL